MRNRVPIIFIINIPNAGFKVVEENEKIIPPDIIFELYPDVIKIDPVHRKFQNCRAVNRGFIFFFLPGECFDYIIKIIRAIWKLTINIGCNTAQINLMNDHLVR
jgi:hypothetical protein